MRILASSWTDIWNEVQSVCSSNDIIIVAPLGQSQTRTGVVTGAVPFTQRKGPPLNLVLFQDHLTVYAQGNNTTLVARKYWPNAHKNRLVDRAKLIETLLNDLIGDFSFTIGTSRPTRTLTLGPN